MNLKKSTALFAIFLLPCGFAISQTGWQWQNPLPTGNTLSAAKYIGAGKYVLAGEEGTILVTSDHGIHWQVLINVEHSRATLNAISFATSDIGIAVGDSGRIVKTTDGGTRWIWNNSGTVESLTGVDMVDPSTIFVVGVDGTILASTDGGENWTSQSVVPIRRLNGVSFANHTIGIVVGNNGLLMRTTDGGVSWNSLSVTTYHLNAIEFIDSNTAIVVGGKEAFPSPLGTILRTTDAGFSWSVQYPSNSGIVTCVAFGSREVGYASAQYFLLKTTNGGLTWTGLPGPTGALGIAFTNPDNGICVGGAILATTNSGNTWVPRSKDDINMSGAVSFSTALNGYIVGGKDALGNALAVSTSDGGNTWALRGCGWTNNRILRTVSAIGGNTAFAAGDYCSTIFKTTNAGQSWVETYTFILDPQLFWYGISFCDENNGTVVGTGGAVMRTTNAGATWNAQASGTAAWLWDISQLNVHVAWAVGEAGTILRTTNSGLTWFAQASNTNGFVLEISALDEDNAFALTQTSLLRTTNGGTTWDSVFIPDASLLHDIAAIDQHTVIAVGEEGTIIRTTDGGSSWVALPSGTRSDLFGVSFPNPNVGTITGYPSTVLRTSNGGTVWVSEQPMARVPSEVTLYQNYPNPFNPTTTIEYGLSKASLVKLTVFDLLGREVTTLVNEPKPPGHHKAMLFGNNLTSGVYIYRLKAGNLTYAKKLILIR